MVHRRKKAEQIYMKSNLILVQNTSLLILFNSVNKGIFQWPVIPSQPLQFLWTKLQHLIHLFVTVSRKPKKKNEYRWGWIHLSIILLSTNVIWRPTSWDSYSWGTWPSTFQPDLEFELDVARICTFQMLPASHIPATVLQLHREHRPSFELCFQLLRTLFLLSCK